MKFNVSRRGFTLIELLIFAGIFAIIMIAFITVFVAVTTVETRQLSVSEVTGQSQFLLQTIQTNVEQSSLVELTQDFATTTLKLRMSNSLQDPTYIYASGTALYIKVTNAGVPQALNSNKVSVSGVAFTKRSNAPSHDSVAVSFTVAYNTQNLKQKFLQAFQLGVARVSAATFDSNVTPSSTDVYAIGSGAARWNSINGVLYFNTNNPPNVGVGIIPGAATTQKLQVDGGDIYIDSAGNGIILKNSIGGCVRLYYTNTGQIATSTINPCP